MQVFDNANLGQLFIGSNQAAVEWKRGENPLGITVVIQLEQEKFSVHHSRYQLDWYVAEPAEVDSGLLPRAYCHGHWDMQSIVAEREASECPDFFDSAAVDGMRAGGHLSIIAAICQMLSQGQTVMLQGTSAGSPTYISYGRLVSPLTPPQF